MPIHWPSAPLHKFHAEPVEIDGLRFASKREAKRYGELRLLERAGEIRALQTQVPVPLMTVAITSGEHVLVSRYIADFRYEERQFDGSWVAVLEDAKGVRTPMYRLKAKWVAAQYGLTIREV